MTAQARTVLIDCESLLADLRSDLTHPLWRLRWAGLMVLLRTVGQVLDKIDGKASPEARQTIQEAWEALKSKKPESRIFWDFIEHERNSILKAYRFTPGVNTTVPVPMTTVNRKTGEETSTPGEPATLDAFMRSGSFAGQDPLELCQDAINFWHTYLDGIDREIQVRKVGQNV